MLVPSSVRKRGRKIVMDIIIRLRIATKPARSSIKPRIALTADRQGMCSPSPRPLSETSRRRRCRTTDVAIPARARKAIDSSDMTASALTTTNGPMVRPSSPPTMKNPIHQTRGLVMTGIVALSNSLGSVQAAPGDQLVSDLQEIGATMTSEGLDAAGADGAAIVDAFKN